MNKAEFQEQIYRQLVTAGEIDPSKVTRADINSISNTVFTVLKNSIRDARIISIRGFGTFEVLRSAARKARNPRTGQPMEIAEKNRIKFKPSESFKEEIN